MATVKDQFHPLPAAVRQWAWAVLVLVLIFGWWLLQLVRFSLTSPLYSHIVLIPFASAFFAWRLRGEMPPPSRPARPLAVALLSAGALVMTGYLAATGSGMTLGKVDSLTLTTLSGLLCFWGMCAWFIGRETLWIFSFPLGFLAFTVPLPTAVVTGIETALQQSSATAAALFFLLSGMSVFRSDLIFELPNITLEVGPQCSGIHSSLALMITSVAAGYLFLRSPTRRIILALAVIPLAILRNGFRVFVIGELCVRIGPDMINSYIHRQGGPIFFALSLIPLLMLMAILARTERENHRPPVLTVL